MKLMKQRLFSKELDRWLQTGGDKTLGELSRLFGEKSFAIIFLLLMALPALPIPTGGITHITELITLLVCLQLIIGRKTIWLPQRWQKIDIGTFLAGKAAQRLMRFIAWFERFSKQRWSRLLVRNPMPSLIGLIILLFTVAAFVAPPFSGLDTLPALGVVTISLALILEDSLILLGGIIIGAAGIGLEIAAGTALYEGVRHFF
jgi:hypothetical protein